MGQGNYARQKCGVDVTRTVWIKSEQQRRERDLCVIRRYAGRLSSKDIAKLVGRTLKATQGLCYRERISLKMERMPICFNWNFKKDNLQVRD